MLTNSKLTNEINASGLSEMDKEILFWYLDMCKTSSQWMAFAGCSFKNNRRMWFVSDRLLKLSRGVK